MSLLRAAQLRFYPTFVTLVLLAQRALALECTAVDQQGEPAPEGTLVETHQAVELAIHNQLAATRVHYRFHNRHSAELELTCELRLQPGELVDGFSYWNGDEQVVGEVLERAAATQVYEDLAQVQRKDPGLLEQIGDVFRFRVFPVAPGEHKLVELRSVTALATRDGRVQYELIGANLPATGGFSLEASVSDALPVRELQLVGVKGDVTQLGPSSAQVKFSSARMAAQPDLALRYRVPSTDYALRASAHRAEGGEDGTFMLIVSPKDVIDGGDALGRDIVFVTDVSGSMEGAPLEQAKLGLYDMLAQLGPQDRFDMISFDDESQAMFGGLVPVGPDTVDDALGRVTELQTRGGTNIQGALIHALGLLARAEAGRARAIVFLTDGQGNDPPAQVLAEVRARSEGTRIYSFGVGQGVNREFLQQLADENRGLAAFVSDERRIHHEMKRLYERIAMPLMMDLTLEIAGGDVHSVYPKQLPDLHRDGEVIVVGRYRRAEQARVRVHGRLADRTADLELTLNLPDREQGAPQLEKVWASRRVRHLLGVAGMRDDEDPELVSEVTRLGVVYNLVTPYTAFLAVPASLQTAEVKEQMRKGRLGYDKKLIDSLEGIRLSQAAIPPGDPVLTVAAPEKAQQVVAYFPFGLIKRLAWDEQREHWYARFLVPRDVKDGSYTIRVRIIHEGGQLEWKEIEIAIDGSEPELDVVADEFAIPGVRFRLEVDPHEPVRELYAYLPGVAKRRTRLVLDKDTGRYTGDLPIPEHVVADTLTIRIVARDRARNRVDQDVRVPVLSDLDCCDDAETCGLIPIKTEENANEPQLALPVLGHAANVRR